MTENSKSKVLTRILIVTNSIVLALSLWAWWQVFLWRSAGYGLAMYAGSLQASADYRSGNLRLYEATVQGERQFTGRTEGPFEVWSWPYYPTLGGPDRYISETFVRGYNLRMRSLYERSEFPAPTGSPSEAVRKSSEQPRRFSERSGGGKDNETQ